MNLAVTRELCALVETLHRRAQAPTGPGFEALLRRADSLIEACATSLDTFGKIHGADPTLSAAADALRELGGVVREMAAEPAVRPDEDRGRGVPAHLVGRAVVFH